MKRLSQSACSIRGQYLGILTADIDRALCLSIINIFGCISENIHCEQYLVFAFILIVSKQLRYEKTCKFTHEHTYVFRFRNNEIGFKLLTEKNTIVRNVKWKLTLS